MCVCVYVCVRVCASVCVCGGGGRERERIVCAYICVSVPLCERLACELD